MKIKTHIRIAVFAFMQMVFACALVFNVASEAVHEIIGHEFSHEEICNEESEKDACHRFTVHHEESDACRGSHQHLKTKTDDCFTCNYFKERSVNFIAGETTSVKTLQCEQISFLVSDHKGQLTYHNSNFLRGPPVLI